MRPLLVKLGGSVITDKARESVLRKAVAKRLIGEIAKADAPCVLLHGAGSFGHPQAKRMGLGRTPVGPAQRAGVSEVLSAVGELHATIVALAQAAGLRPISVPLHLICRSEGDDLLDMPHQRIRDLLHEGYTPVLSGTAVRDAVLGWRVVSADEIMDQLAGELDPQLAVFVTDVEGVLDGSPEDPDASVIDLIRGGDDLGAIGLDGRGDDVTGAMRGKVQRAIDVGRACPVLIINGMVRSRLLYALKGRTVPGTRVGER